MYVCYSKTGTSFIHLLYIYPVIYLPKWAFHSYRLYEIPSIYRRALLSEYRRFFVIPKRGGIHWPRFDCNTTKYKVGMGKRC